MNFPDGPYGAKQRLAWEVVKMYHGESEADRVVNEWRERQRIRKERRALEKGRKTSSNQQSAVSSQQSATRGEE